MRFAAKNCAKDLPAWQGNFQGQRQIVCRCEWWSNRTVLRQAVCTSLPPADAQRNRTDMISLKSPPLPMLDSCSNAVAIRWVDLDEVTDLALLDNRIGVA